MMSPHFQKLLITLFLMLIISLVVLALYCRNKSQSYIGTGRVAEIEAWSIKAAFSWILSGGLSIGFILMIL
ncbi:hypothetical protein [Mucilaginibacter glaciei]|uniref:Uncharacterized protein n=1 Tax=Mucilaginibacter glaciei TaxID=2772109 RepID=A0A926S1Q8_9SPHI|nr:hypothetical protein [Mucilaginibacter glaciei]MBD1393072.1 hypothetical protein [Mucilaginibacter glaciei]